MIKTDVVHRSVATLYQVEINTYYFRKYAGRVQHTSYVRLWINLIVIPITICIDKMKIYLKKIIGTFLLSLVSLFYSPVYSVYSGIHESLWNFWDPMIVYRHSGSPATVGVYGDHTRLILRLRPAYERRSYIVTTSLIGSVQY